MKLRKILSAAIVVAGLSIANTASAYVTSVENICEITPNGVNTVNVKLFSSGMYQYIFQNIPTSQIHSFPSTTISMGRKFALPAGTYKLTYVGPNATTGTVYNNNIVVKPYQVVGSRCVFLRPLDKAEAVRRPSQ